MHNMPRKLCFSEPLKGFSLIEMLVVLAIITVIAAIAYPAYTEHVVASRRAEATVALSDLAARVERYYSENNTYVGATIVGMNAPSTTENGFYNLQITAATATTYSIQAVPTGAQASADTACATLTLNQLGQKGITGSGTVQNCW